MAHSKKNQKFSGFTLTEIAIVMGVIGTIIALVWGAASNTKDAQRESDGLNEIQTVAQNILNIMQGRSFSTTGVITPQMIAAQAIPVNYLAPLNPTTEAFNPWGQGLSWAGNTFKVFAIDAKTFRVSSYMVSKSGCVAILLGNTACQVGQTGCPKAAYTNLSVTYLYPSATTGWQQVMTTTQAATMCTANSYTGGNNSVEFDYTL